MTTLDLIASLAGILAWPAVVTTIVLLFRPKRRPPRASLRTRLGRMVFDLRWAAARRRTINAIDRAMGIR